MMNFVASRVLLSVVFCLLVLTASAQPGPPPDPDVPITGIEILLGIGGLFGVKRLYDSRKKK